MSRKSLVNFRVDDGTLPMDSHISKVEMKRRLKDMIDIPTYLSLDSKQRHELVMKHVKDLSAQLDQEKAARDLERLEMKGTRKFDLIDITKL